MNTLTEAERLSSLAQVLLSSGPPPTTPVAVGVVDLDDSADLWLNELAVPDLAAALRGFVAPPDWWAFGVLSTGTVRHLDRPTDDGLPGRVIVHLVARSGVAVSLVGGTGTAPIELGVDQPIIGRLADACRRVLGLPTPPPPGDSRLLFALQWLDRVSVEAFLRVDDRLSWSEVARMHPFADILDRSGLDCDLDDHLTEVGNAAGQAWPWERIRAACASGREPLATIAPAEAGWADDGAFARILLEDYPELDDLLVSLGALLAPSVISRINDTLRHWDVRPRSGAAGPTPHR
jgi:hypothetical protein